MKIAIRLDDITPDMDWNKFERFKKLMDDAYVLPLIGIVPDCQDPKLHIDAPRADFWAYIKTLEENGWTVSMHGCHHVYTTDRGGMFPLNRESEFAGLPFEEQKSLIREGKTILEDHGIVTDLFMAPAHSYDRNTLRALRECGFTKMTDGFGKAPYIRDGMTFYPISFDRGSVLKDRGKGVTTFVVHVNVMEEQDFAFYEKVFKEQDMLPYRELLYYKARERSAAGNLKEYLMAAGKRAVMSLRNRA